MGDCHDADMYEPPDSLMDDDGYDSGMLEELQFNLSGGSTDESLGEAECTRETEKAVLCRTQAGDRWIPKSAVSPDSEVYKMGGKGNLVVAGWWAKKNPQPKAEDLHRIPNVAALSSTAKAVLVSLTDNTECWIPRGQIHPSSEVKEDPALGVLVVSSWFAKQKGWAK